MSQNEKTSPHIASLASKYLKMDNPKNMTNEMWAEIKSVIASAFTQAPDKPINPLLEAFKAQQKLRGSSGFNLGARGFGLLPKRK